MEDSSQIAEQLRTAERHNVVPPTMALELTVGDLKFFLVTLLVDETLRDEFNGREEYAPRADKPFSWVGTPLEAKRQQRKINLITKNLVQLDKHHETDHQRALNVAERLEAEHGAAWLDERLPEAYNKKLRYARDTEPNHQKLLLVRDAAAARRGRPKSAATWKLASADNTNGAILRPSGGKGASQRRKELVQEANRLCDALGTPPSACGVAMFWFGGGSGPDGAATSTRKFVFENRDFYKLIDLMEAFVPALRALREEETKAAESPASHEEKKKAVEPPSNPEMEPAFSLMPTESLPTWKYGAGHKRARTDRHVEHAPIVTDLSGRVYRVEHLYRDAAFDAISQYEKCAALESECLAVVQKVGEKYNTPNVFCECPLSAVFLVPLKYPEHEPKEIAQASPCFMILWKYDILLLHVRPRMRGRNLARGLAQYLVWSIPSGQKRFVNAPACLTGPASRIWRGVGFLSSAEADPSATFTRRGKEKARPSADVVTLQLSFEKP